MGLESAGQLTPGTYPKSVGGCQSIYCVLHSGDVRGGDGVRHMGRGIGQEGGATAHPDNLAE